MLKNPNTITIVSFMWGFAIAIVLFRHCADGHCYVIQGPAKKDIENKIYKIEDSCYKMEPKATKCRNDSIKEA